MRAMLVWIAVNVLRVPEDPADVEVRERRRQVVFWRAVGEEMRAIANANTEEIMGPRVEGTAGLNLLKGSFARAGVWLAVVVAMVGCVLAMRWQTLGWTFGRMFGMSIA